MTTYALVVQGAFVGLTAAEAAHYATVAKQEGIRQGLVAKATNQAGVKAAELSFYRAVLASARANGLQWAHLQEAIYEANNSLE